MNTDRFLARVFDKQEKKMIYKHTKFIYDDILYVYEGISDFGIIASEFIPELGFCKFVNLEFEDRFIQMQCTGLKDEDGDLVYEGDIINSLVCGFNRAVIKRDDFLHAFIVELDGKKILDLFALNNFNVRGTIYEDPEFLEQNK